MSSMDKKIEKKRFTFKKVAIVLLSAGLLLFLGYNVLFADFKSTLNVDKDRLSIATVKEGIFQDYIPRTGNIIPGRTVYLDARKGGYIDEIISESGADVAPGEVLLVLNNSDLELEVLSRESSLYEQLNILRNTRLSLKQNNLNLQSQLAEIEYQLQLLKPQYDRAIRLLKDSVISQQQWEDIRERYKYNQRRYNLTRASYVQDSTAMGYQLDQLEDSEKRMLQSLQQVRQMRDQLTVTAPLGGQLSLLDIELGQSIVNGERLGQIDILSSYKVRLPIDELYLPRVAVGQQGSFDYDGQEYRVEIDKVFPDIQSGVFEVDMQFTDSVPENIKRGQSVRVRLELGNSEERVLLPVGGFFKDTGGNWVYVLDGDGRAVRRDISLGRKNPDYYEVLSGLEPGDQVIVSSYDLFGQNEVLNLN